MKSGHRILAPATVSARFRVTSKRWRLSPERARIFSFIIWVAVATISFIQPLTKLFVYAAQSDLLSYIPLVPLVTAYLLYTRRTKSPAMSNASVPAAIAFGCLSAAILLTASSAHAQLTANDFLGVVTTAYLAAIAAGGFLFLGRAWMHAAAFPLSFSYS